MPWCYYALFGDICDGECERCREEYDKERIKPFGEIIITDKWEVVK